MFTTYSLRHSRARMHAPRRASCVSARGMCLKRHVAIGSQGSGFVSTASIFVPSCRAALVASFAEMLQSCSASATAGLSHAAATTQTLSPPLAHPRGCRHTQVALRCTTVSLFLAPSRLVAQAPLHRALPNNSWCGRAESGVAFLGTAAARRTTSRWLSKGSHA